MKKIAILLLVLMMVACTPTTQKITPRGLKEINYTELSQKMKQKVQFMLYIGRPDCGDCQNFEPILHDYLKKHSNAGLYYLNIKEFRDNSRKKEATSQEKEFYQNLSRTFQFDWTPTLEIITNGKIGKQYQYLDEDYYDIKDRPSQIKQKEVFINQFHDYMNAYFKGDE